MIEILVADDQGMVRTLLTGVCDAADDMTVVGEAESGEAARKAGARRRISRRRR